VTELLPPTESRPPVRTRSRSSGLRLRTLTDTAPRHASNLELFFDLVLAVAVGALGQALASNPTATGFLHFGALFVPVWWAWVGSTFYADRFESDDIVYRLLVLAAMAAIVGVAVNTGDAFASPTASLHLAGSYVTIRVVLVVLYLRAYRLVPVARPLCARYAIGFSLGAATWLASCFVSPPARFWLWGAGLIVELATPLVSASAISRVPFHASHIPERFGSFTIVVLGETVFLTATGVGGTLHLAGISIAVTGFLMAAMEWWIYFEFVDASPLRRGLIAGQTYTYGHLFIFMGITATGAGVLLAIRDASGRSLPEGVRAALCGGVAAFVLAIGIIQLVNTRNIRDVAVVARLLIGALCLGLLVAPYRLAPAAISAALVVLLVAQVLVEAGRRTVRPVSTLPATDAAPQ
jgi:low temperature requirement protein LtrA